MTSSRVAAEVGDQRVVGVEHQRARAGQLAHDLRPAVGDRLELAVAVELVAEQVAEQQRPRPQLRARPRSSQNSSTSNRPSSPSIPPRRGAPVEQRRGDAAGHVRAGAVVDERRCPRARGSWRPSPRWSSCRWWPRSPRSPAAGGATSSLIACGSSAHQHLARGGWCRRRVRRGGRAHRRRARRRSSLGARSCFSLRARSR